MKKLNFKALMINHVEKIVFGFFGLIVLLILAKTSWGRYPQNPDVLKQKVKEIRDKVSSEANVWPITKQQAHKVVDFNDKARQWFVPMMPIAVAKYSFTPPLFHPLYRKDEPRREPTFEPVQLLIAKAGLAPLSMINPAALQQMHESAPAVAAMEPAQPKMDDGEFAAPRPAGPVGVPGVPQPNNAMPGRAHAAPRPAGAPGSRPPAGGSAPGGSSSVRLFNGMPGAPPGGAREETPDIPMVKALGVRFVAVRGVFPLAKQIEAYKSSLKTTHADAQSKFEILDFVLERQKAAAGPDPWNETLSPWEVVNTDMSKELLAECSDFDANDPVPIALHDSVITSPLPLRLIGYWTKSEYATHPRIKDMELKEDAIEQQNTMLQSLSAAMSDTQAAEAEKPRRKGFSGLQKDAKSMVTAVKRAPGGMDAYQSQMQQMQAQMMSSPSGGSAASRPTMGPGAGTSSMMAMSRPQDLDRLIATSKYLLFRYFDFDVESGMAYRYRVRLKLGNPNYQLPPEEMAGADPEIANGVDRMTPFSNISTPVVIDNTFNFYLRDVERDPYRDEKVKTTDPKPVAVLDVFDWDTRFGTVVKDVLNIPAIGAFIGGVGGTGSKRETAVLDLVEGAIVKKKDWKLTSMDVLVDVETDPEISLDQHPDLKLTQAATKGNVRLGLTEDIVVATSTGDLKLLDPVSEKSAEEGWNKRMTQERASFTESNGTDAKPKSRLDAPSEEGSSRQRTSRKQNPLRTQPGMQ